MFTGLAETIPLVTHELMQLLQQAQRIAAQAVIRGFWTVAFSIVEVESSLIPLEQRLRNQAVAFWVSIQVHIDYTQVESRPRNWAVVHNHWLSARKRNGSFR
jgi:hypothetical protein